jgi:hypothetical protein
MQHTSSPRPARVAATSIFIFSLSITALLALPGCQAFGLFGAMEESRRRNSTRPVEPEYRGLEGKSFAVLVAAPAVLQAEFPNLVDRITFDVSARLANEAGASGMVPPRRILDWTYNKPNWVARPLGDVAKDLGVERLVYIDFTEYRLNDKGNSYLWDGAAGANVSVVEADSSLKDDYAFTKGIAVKFPDKGGFSQADVSGPAVNTELSRRLAERIAWLFFLHEEPYYPKY